MWVQAAVAAVEAVAKKAAMEAAADTLRTFELDWASPLGSWDALEGDAATDDEATDGMRPY
jgi:hypothetical protein